MSDERKQQTQQGEKTVNFALSWFAATNRPNHMH
jgi:hypothetical protein